MTWLITGGAGYIGAHVVRTALAAGYELVVIDDLSTGIPHRLPAQVPLEKATLTDFDAVADVFNRYDIKGVVHIAAKKQVGESVARPDYYWEQNIKGFENLLEAMAQSHVSTLVFSSSAAVYGQPDIAIEERISENLTCAPINPYGATKLTGEWLARAHSISHGTSVAALRYFNVAGAGAQELGDVFALNLVPIAIDAMNQGKPVQVFGNDYPTPDGTCVRDYVHVQDLAEAHVSAMRYVADHPASFQNINIGTGRGASVLEVLAALERASGQTIDYEMVGRRTGDPSSLVADVNKAWDVLGWVASKDLDDIAQSAWHSNVLN